MTGGLSHWCYQAIAISVSLVEARCMVNIHKYLYRRLPLYQKTINLLRKVVLPGAQGVPLWYIIRFFTAQLSNEVVTMRASAIAFNLFLALVPSLIFLFTLIPYFPIENLEQEAMNFLSSYMPDQAFATIDTTVRDILVKRRGGLLSFGFLFTVYFATNGIYSLLDAFNQGGARSFAQKWLTALGLMLSTTLVLIVGVSLYVFVEISINEMLETDYFQTAPSYYVYKALQILIVLGVIYISISMLFRFGPSQKNLRPPFFSPGSIIATLLMLATGYGFAFYVDNFSQYNKFYGSLGALIVLMIWFYINAIVLIIGYELNQSILMARQFRHQNRRKLFDRGQPKAERLIRRSVQ